MQLLLSINFCLTAIAAATDSDGDKDINFIIAPDNIEAKLNDQFDYIWHCLKVINATYPSELLRKLMSQHQSGIKYPIQDGKSDLRQKDLDKRILSLHTHLEAFSDKFTKDITENSNFMLHKDTLDNQLKDTLDNQFTEIFNSLQEIHNLYQSKEFLSNEEKMLSRDRLEELLVFLQNFLTEDSTKPLDGFFLASLDEETPHLLTKRNAEFNSNEPSPRIFKLSNKFDKIWHHLGKINKIYPSELLQRLISQHQKSKKHPIQHSVSEISQKDLEESILFLRERLLTCLIDQTTKNPIEGLNKNSLSILSKQLAEICSILDKIYNFCHSKTHLSNEEKAFLSNQLGEILVFSQNFPTPIVDKETSHLAKRETDSSSFVNKSSIRMELEDQFYQTWVCLGKINAIYQSKLLQELISHPKDQEFSYDESLEEISKEILDDQFIQLFIQLQKALKKQNEQLYQIKHHLKTVYKIYDLEKESLSQEEKAFLQDQLGKLLYFFHNFITETSLQDRNVERAELSSLDEIQGLLNNCEEEDFLIYPQYEYIINSQEANVSDLLKSSQTKNNIQNNFLYFNKSEGLIELRHIQLLNDDKYQDSYTTTWSIRPADVNLIKDWKKGDPISIDKTSFFSVLTMRGESLQYTLNNNKKSVRANFVCKSSNQNTYAILSIDYLEKVVVLENGPCLFVKDGDLKEWHAKDTVVLQKYGSATDTNNSHELINKTRGNERVWILLKNKL